MGLIHYYEEPKNYEMAQFYLEYAMEHGITVKQRYLAQHILADLYLFSNPQIKYKETAIEFLHNNMMNFNDGKSAVVLATFYLGSEELQQKEDLVKVMQYTLVSQKMGVFKANNALNLIKPSMTPSQISEAKKRADEYMMKLKNEN